MFIYDAACLFMAQQLLYVISEALSLNHKNPSGVKQGEFLKDGFQLGALEVQ